MKFYNLLIQFVEQFEDVLLELFDKLSQNKHALSAKFGRKSKLISSSYKGLSITGTEYLTPKKSKEHLFCIAPSGVGKSTVFLIPSALNISSASNGGSMIITNPSGELSAMTNYFLHRGYKVYNFNPDDKTQSIYYNPLLRIKTPSDVVKVATMLVNKSGKPTKDYWDLKSIELISLLIEFLIGKAKF